MVYAIGGKINAKERHWSTWFEAPRRKHSQKPDMVRDIIDKCFVGEK